MREIARYRCKLAICALPKEQISELFDSLPIISLASVVSDPFGKTATNIMKELMQSEVIEDDKIFETYS